MSKVSIIIPAYNGSGTIRQTLDSILRQTYKNYEIVIVDDGSSDSTVEIVKRLVPSARIVQQKNQGTLAARQTGIEVATGDWIATLDQDDRWYPEKLAVQFEALRNYPEVGLIFSNMHAVDEDDNSLDFNVVPDTKCYTPSWEELLLLHPIASSTALFKKDAVMQIGGLDSTFGFSGALGDTDTFVRLSEVTQIHFINRCLGDYRWSEMRPGRLVGFLDNLQLYSSKHWNSPRLHDDTNSSLREKFVQTCSNYALHIYRLLMNQYDGKIPNQLLEKLNSHHPWMEHLFGDLYREIVKLKPLDLNLFNSSTDAEKALLFLYLLRLDLQNVFPEVQIGNQHRLREWGRSVSSGQHLDSDFEILSQFTSELDITADSIGSGNSKPLDINAVRSLVFQSLSLHANKLFPLGSKRRRWLAPIFQGVKLLLMEGWVSFGKAIFRYIVRRLNSLKVNFRQKWQSTFSFLNTSKELIRSDITKSKLKLLLSDPDNRIKLAHFDAPTIAIVVTLKGNQEDLYECLESLMAHSTVPYRIILVHSNSSSQVEAFVDRLDNVTVVQTTRRTGSDLGSYDLFRHHLKKEEYVLFVSDDVVVTNGYLDQMLSAIERSDGCGAVCCKVVSTSGYLLEAGGIIFDDGRYVSYGRGDDPGRPEYAYVRQVRFASTACLLVRKEFMEGMRTAGLFHSASEICKYLEDSSYKITYQPDAVVLCRILAQPYRSNMRPRRSSVYSPSDSPHARTPETNIKILVVDEYIPAVRYGAGFPRAYEMLVCLASLGYFVTFVPVVNPVKANPETSILQQKGVEVFWDSYANLEELAIERSGYYDLVIISRPPVFKRWSSVIRKYFPRAAMIYDAEAIFYTRDILKSQVVGENINESQKKIMIEEEMTLLEEADLVITVSDKDRQMMRQRSSQPNLEIWGHVQELHESNDLIAQRRDLLFLGSFLAGPGSPNEDAALYFASEIFPAIRKSLCCKLYIVGSNPTPAVKELAAEEIVVTGYVQDLGKYFDSCRVNVVPTRFAAGIPLKLIEAMSHGIPSVVTRIIADPLTLSDQKQVLIAHNSSEFVEKVIELYTNEELWHELRRNSLSYVRANFSRTSMQGKLRAIIERGMEIRNGKGS